MRDAPSDRTRPGSTRASPGRGPPVEPRGDRPDLRRGDPSAARALRPQHVRDLGARRRLLPGFVAQVLPGLGRDGLLPGDPAAPEKRSDRTRPRHLPALRLHLRASAPAVERAVPAGFRPAVRAGQVRDPVPRLVRRPRPGPRRPRRRRPPRADGRARPRRGQLPDADGLAANPPVGSRSARSRRAGCCREGSAGGRGRHRRWRTGSRSPRSRPPASSAPPPASP